jgi:glycosyltransferase involved in cell wall biosynthesis
MKFPKISFAIPVYNEEKNIIRCLDSISIQNYPHDCIEVVIADAGCTDKTIPLIQKWNEENDIHTLIVANPKKIAEFGKAQAVKQAKGDYIVFIDADNQLVGTDWLTAGIKAFETFPDAQGIDCTPAATGISSLNDYLTECLYISDPLAYGIAPPPIKKSETHHDGYIFEHYIFKPGFPTGVNGFIYKAQTLKTHLYSETLEEGQISVWMEQQQNAFFIRVKNRHIKHFYVQTLKDFLKKRKKIAVKHLTRITERETWVSHTPRPLWVAALIHGSFFCPAIKGIYNSILSKNKNWLWHGPACCLTTFTYLINWIIIKMTGKTAW